MVRDYFTAKELVEILDIYEVSAWELLDGVIEFESSELEELAAARGLTIAQLIEV